MSNTQLSEAPAAASPSSELELELELELKRSIRPVSTSMLVISVP
jgi:hypothetical protein